MTLFLLRIYPKPLVWPAPVSTGQHSERAQRYHHQPRKVDTLAQNFKETGRPRLEAATRAQRGYAVRREVVCGGQEPAAGPQDHRAKPAGAAGEVYCSPREDLVGPPGKPSVFLRWAYQVGQYFTLKEPYD